MAKMQVFAGVNKKVVHRSGIISLPALAREDVHKLNHLMHDTRSEFSRNIKNYNTATESSMNRNLTRTHRDVYSFIDNLDRQQQATYKSMCKIVEIQKQKAKDMYNKYHHSTSAEKRSSVNKNTKQARLQSKPQKLPKITGRTHEKHEETVAPLNSSGTNSKTVVTQKLSVSNSKEMLVKDRHETDPVQVEDIAVNMERPTLSYEVTLEDIRLKQEEDNSKKKAEALKQEGENAEKTGDSFIKNLDTSKKCNTASESLKENKATLIDIKTDVTLTNSKNKEKCELPELLKSIDSTPQVLCKKEKRVATDKPLTINFPSRASQNKAFFTASLRSVLPAITEDMDHKQANSKNKGKKIKEPPKCNHKHSDRGQTDRVKSPASYTEDERILSSLSKSKHDSDQLTVASSIIAKSLRNKIAELEKQHIEDFLKRSNLKTKFNSDSYKMPHEDNGDAMNRRGSIAPSLSFSNNTKGTGHLPKSIAAERRRIAKLRVAHRKAVLDSEDVHIYKQQSDGSYVRAPMTYKRKHFLPPSNREFMERQKILKSVQFHTDNHVEKIGEFFTKLDLPIAQLPLKKKKLPPEFKHLEEPEPDSDPEPEPVVRQKSEIKPLSEVAKSVAYIREYIRPGERDQLAQVATSWNQSAA